MVTDRRYNHLIRPIHRMSMDFLSHLNLTTGALLIFALCVFFVLLRGVARLLFGAVVLGASAWLAYWVWQQAPAWSIKVLEKPNGLITTGAPVAAFVLAMWLIRSVLKLVMSPFMRPGFGAPSAFTNVPIRLIFALLAAAGLWLIGVTWVHHAGSLAEIRGFVEKTADPSKTSVYLLRMKASVEAVLPKDWIKLLDPLTEPARLAMAKLIAAESRPADTSVIDSKTGKPYPRAVVVADATLQGLARQKDFSGLLRHPNLTRVLDDPKVKQAIEERKK
ncbi:MAG: hypothetical protein DVB25_06085 [Verrucomicrobia bacterium]|nr:MAG: hypothetical protein DVB25_06085 [Verrucomicrobiota bacterium]